jgi:hypothetical protein
MTAAEELTALETAYEAWIEAGCPQSYTTGDGRTVTRASAEWMSKRIDTLRAESARGTSSGFSGANFRHDD